MLPLQRALSSPKPLASPSRAQDGKTLENGNICPQKAQQGVQGTFKHVRDSEPGSLRSPAAGATAESTRASLTH